MMKKKVYPQLEHSKLKSFVQLLSSVAGLSANLRSDLPVLFMWGNKDPAAATQQIKKAVRFVPKLEIVELAGVGHWVMVEAKDEVTKKVLGWLATNSHEAKL